MWEFKDGLRNQIVIMWILSAIATLVWMLPAYFLGLLLNEFQLNGLSEQNIYRVLLFLFSIFATAVGGWFFHGPSRVMERSIGYKIGWNFRKHLYNAVVSLPLTWHSDHDSGDTIDKVNKATDSVFEFSATTFNWVRVFIRIIGVSIVLAAFDWRVACLALLFIIIAVLVLVKFDKILAPQYSKISEYYNKATAKVFDALSNITTVKVLSIEKPVSENINRAWWVAYPEYMQNKILVEWKWFTGSFIFDILLVLPLLIYILSVYKSGGAILVGTISTMYLYLRDLTDVYYMIAGRYDEVAINKVRVSAVKEIEDNYKKIAKVKKKNLGGWEELEISSLKFKYDENLEIHSLDIEKLSIKKGEKVALIGESGSGKSTILKVLHGMYENASAEIKVKMLEKVSKVLGTKTNFVDLNLHSTLVPQEPEVFSASIKENITLLLNFTDQEIEQATKMAEFFEVAESLPKKFDSVVNEKGVNLSGGQKQRLALSRALLFSQDKEIIFLDESTSSVDPVNEVKIYKNIFENFPGVTILASIHKMNLLKYFDRIIILEGGKIKIQGTFDYLLQHDEGFAQAWDEFVKTNSIA
jgi:ABC-type multidrug transport system fused ATPase/permease subunit